MAVRKCRRLRRRMFGVNVGADDSPSFVLAHSNPPPSFFLRSVAPRSLELGMRRRRRLCGGISIRIPFLLRLLPLSRLSIPLPPSPFFLSSLIEFLVAAHRGRQAGRQAGTPIGRGKSDPSAEEATVMHASSAATSFLLGRRVPFRITKGIWLGLINFLSSAAVQVPRPSGASLFSSTKIIIHNGSNLKQ